MLDQNISCILSTTCTCISIWKPHWLKPGWHIFLHSCLHSVQLSTRRLIQIYQCSFRFHTDWTSCCASAHHPPQAFLYFSQNRFSLLDYISPVNKAFKLTPYYIPVSGLGLWHLDSSSLYALPISLIQHEGNNSDIKITFLYKTTSPEAPGALGDC